MAEYRRSEVALGLFIVVLFVVLTVGVFAYFALKATGRPIPLVEQAGVKCECWFEDVGSLDKAAKVTVGGHRVGTVNDIEVTAREITAAEAMGPSSRPGLKAGHVRHLVKVSFSLNDPHLRLTDDATVAVVQDGFIGQWYLALDPGTWTGPPPPLAVSRRGGVIMVNPSRVGTIKDLLPTGTRILEGIDTVVRKIERGLLDPLLSGNEASLKSLVPDIQATIASVRDGVADVRKLLDPLAEDSPARNANQLLKDADQAVIALRKQLTEDVIPALNVAIADGRRALDSAAAAMDRVKKSVAEADPKVQKVLADLADESGRLRERLDDLQKRMATLLDDADHLVALRQPEVAEIVRTFLNTSWEVEQAARKVRSNPAVLIFGDDEKRLEAEPRDDTGLRNRARVKPYEQRDESPARKD